MIISKVIVGPHCRLAWYYPRDAEHSWDAEWQQFDRAKLDDFLEFSKRDQLFMKTFLACLPREGRILEGGCGLSQWVLILSEMGYQIEGVDNSQMVVERINNFYPRVTVRFGDVLSLDYPDSHFSAYISLGVVEHTEEGPERALTEAHRVLKPGGVLLCSVPYFNLVRLLSVRSTKWRDGLTFYQWAFTRQEFAEILEQCGFRVKDAIPYAAIKTWTDLVRRHPPRGTDSADEVRMGAPAASRTVWRRELKHFVRNYLLGFSPVRRLSGHMLLFVAERAK